MDTKRPEHHWREREDKYDLLTFEERDVIDAEADDRHRAQLTGLPERPGTRR